MILAYIIAGIIFLVLALAMVGAWRGTDPLSDYQLYGMDPYDYYNEMRG
tara:strand:- start:1343 stop:1489 length:147 start_codon:yes stop_codon:yes gene_type:complete